LVIRQHVRLVGQGIRYRIDAALNGSSINAGVNGKNVPFKCGMRNGARRLEDGGWALKKHSTNKASVNIIVAFGTASPTWLMAWAQRFMVTMLRARVRTLSAFIPRGTPNAGLGLTSAWQTERRPRNAARDGQVARATHFYSIDNRKRTPASWTAQA
jgi:hypothetical protein